MAMGMRSGEVEAAVQVEQRVTSRKRKRSSCALDWERTVRRRCDPLQCVQGWNDSGFEKNPFTQNAKSNAAGLESNERDLTNEIEAAWEECRVAFIVRVDEPGVECEVDDPLWREERIGGSIEVVVDELAVECDLRAGGGGAFAWDFEALDPAMAPSTTLKSADGARSSSSTATAPPQPWSWSAIFRGCSN